VKKDKKETCPETTDDPPIGLAMKQGCDILYAIFDIMLLAICHEYPLQQWKMVWMLFIKRELGNLHLDRLCCIMIFEAQPCNCYCDNSGVITNLTSMQTCIIG